MKLYVVEVSHDDGDGHSKGSHERGEACANPAELPMQLYVAASHQRRLKDVEGDPSGERGAMHPEKKWPRDRGMKQILVDRPAESGDYDRRKQQRHREVEVLFQQSVVSRD